MSGICFFHIRIWSLTVLLQWMTDSAIGALKYANGKDLKYQMILKLQDIIIRSFR